MFPASNIWFFARMANWSVDLVYIHMYSVKKNNTRDCSHIFIGQCVVHRYMCRDFKATTIWIWRIAIGRLLTFSIWSPFMVACSTQMNKHGKATTHTLSISFDIRFCWFGLNEWIKMSDLKELLPELILPYTYINSHSHNNFAEILIG